jgi:hypothetical protein
MQDLEKQIIELIQNNTHLSDDLKKRYIMALFLMDSSQYVNYMKLLQGFSQKCHEVEAGLFILNADEARRMQMTFEDVKRDILKKIQNKNKLK